MYSDLVKRLRTMCPEAYNNLMDFIYGAGQAMAEAADAIEELSQEYESVAKSLTESVELVRKLQSPRWVSVTERLPEKRKWVLCQCRANITDVLRFENAEWYHDPTHVYMFEFVTHWMPLPSTEGLNET